MNNNPGTSNAPSLTKQTKRAIFCGGCKGGVGKSAVARAILEWYVLKGIPTTPWEGDDANPTLLRFFPEARRILSRESLGFAPLFNALETDDSVCHVVDLGAGAETTLAKFDDLIGLASAARELGARVTFLYVLAPDPESIMHLPDLADRYGKNVDYVLVRANWAPGAWDFWERTKIRARLCNELGAAELSLSAIDGLAFSRINEASLSWAAATKDKRFPFTSRAIARRWLTNTCGEFDRCGKLLLP